jgi:hypothetical protein
MNKQQIIPDKVIKMAKAMNWADQNGAQLIIIQKRQWGKTAARKLAKGEQILPSDKSQATTELRPQSIF